MTAPPRLIRLCSPPLSFWWVLRPFSLGLEGEIFSVSEEKSRAGVGVGVKRNWKKEMKAV